MRLIKFYLKCYAAGLVLGLGLIGSYAIGVSIPVAITFRQHSLNALTLMLSMLLIGWSMEWLFSLHAHRKGPS